jgi:GNAT superfamily N-acetyltransferase
MNLADLMKTRVIDTNNKKDVNRFIRFPFDLYRDSPYWVPPMISDMRFNLDRSRHPTYRHADVDFILAENEGQVVGRIAVIHNHHHSQYQHKKTAFFYYFDVIEDIQVARHLFQAVFDWASMRGLDEVYGPHGLLRFDGNGLLVKGFEHRPALGMPYNYPYYDSFVRDSGFEKATEYLSGYLTSDYEVPEKVMLVAEKVKERKGYTIKTFKDKKEMWQWVDRVGEIFNTAFVYQREFFPITPDEMRIIARNIISVADPRLMKMVMNGEEIIGFIIAYPDISAAIQKVKGRLWPFGWLTLLRAQKTTRYLNLNGIGLLPGYQGMGGTALLYSELYKTGKPMGYEYAETVQVDVNNFLSKSEHEENNITWHKAHRSYIKKL